MSMTPVDKITVPLPAQASALLTQIASRMFDHLVKNGEALPLTEEAFDAWRLIREHAHLYGNHGLIVLEVENEARLVDALYVAHKLFHRYEFPMPVPSSCHCELAKIMREVAALVLRGALLEGWGRWRTR
jgi:hypothetical protein